jgi:anti-anti-sigma regulatory factor
MTAEMISRLPESDSSTLRVQPEGLLDFNAIKVHHLLEEVRSGKYIRVVIDLGQTTTALDSGLAMLLFFQQQVGELKNAIYLVRSSGPFREKMARYGQSDRFHFIGCGDCPVDNELPVDLIKRNTGFVKICRACEKYDSSVLNGKQPSVSFGH